MNFAVWIVPGLIVIAINALVTSLAGHWGGTVLFELPPITVSMGSYLAAFRGHQTQLVLAAGCGVLAVVIAVWRRQISRAEKALFSIFLASIGTNLWNGWNVPGVIKTFRVAGMGQDALLFDFTDFCSTIAVLGIFYFFLARRLGRARN